MENKQLNGAVELNLEVRDLWRKNNFHIQWVQNPSLTPAIWSELHKVRRALKIRGNILTYNITNFIQIWESSQNYHGKVLWTLLFEHMNIDKYHIIFVTMLLYWQSCLWSKFNAHLAKKLLRSRQGICNVLSVVMIRSKLGWLFMV